MTVPAYILLYREGPRPHLLLFSYTELSVGLCTLYHIRLWFNALAVPGTLEHF